MSTAHRMLDGSLQGLRDIFESYGLPWSTAKWSAERMMQGHELDEEVGHVIEAAQRSKDVDAKSAVKKRFNLAVNARRSGSSSSS